MMRAGTEGELEFTPQYAPPEVITAFEAGQYTMTAEASSDVWSLGIMAFEILTDTRVFAPGTDMQTIQNAIMGHTPMPWEGPERAQLLPKLKMFKSDVMQCLDRDPKRRPPIRVVVNAWRHMFDAMSTKVTRVVSAPRTVC
ncbi:MAG: protein kinase [Myxococcales bacterium]|nr:protein kinase [Myxococcales bacterium]